MNSGLWRLKVLAGAIFMSGVFSSGSTWAQSEPMVDTHAHFQTGKARDFAAALKTMLSKMDELQIARTLLMPPPITDDRPHIFFDIEDLQFALKSHPGRVALLGGSSLNVMLHHTPSQQVTPEIESRFRARAKAILAQGAVGFGELAIHHLSLPVMGAQHPYESIPADHPLLLVLADVAAEHDVPIDLHMDLVPEQMPLPDTLRSQEQNPAVLEPNAESFKRLLGHNPKAKFVWSHVGFEPLLTRHPQRVRFWLREYPNLYMSFRLARGTQHPASALGPDGQVKPAWVALLAEFPDRFLLGSDSFYDRDGVARGGAEPGSDQGLRALRSFINRLPPQVAKAVAHENALRLYKLSGAAQP